MRRYKIIDTWASREIVRSVRRKERRIGERDAASSKCHEKSGTYVTYARGAAEGRSRRRPKKGRRASESGKDRKEEVKEEEKEEEEEEEEETVRMQTGQPRAQVSDASNNIFMPYS
ncbi:hypothetical protein V1478_015467 [Vespula squamosa]|uniref:Uncharacterized protein n=1 Tax=Vespula squamosa TaxID=30214 RepID=A0ABD2A559_VESSQ